MSSEADATIPDKTLIQHFPLSGGDTEITVHDDEGRELLRRTLSTGNFLIGQAEECHLQVNAPGISRRHAYLSISSSAWHLTDEGSTNGLAIGTQRLSGKVRIWPGQEIRMGSTVLRLRRLTSTPSAVVGLLENYRLRGARYAIGPAIAEGGMGAILDTRDGNMERRVAMKVLLDGDNSEALTRFIAEARITGQLEHPNIVPIHDIGADAAGQLYYTMKLVRGVTLADIIHGLASNDTATVEKYSLPVMLTIFQKVCDALAFAHSRGVIHRDLKPANIMLGDYGEVLVMDWGLAKLVNSAPAASPAAPLYSSIIRPGLPEGTHSFGSTLSGTIMGTPQYMAPEQARGEIETLDVRTDLYSLGAILFEILHLRPPYSDGAAMEIIQRVTRGEVEWAAPKKSAAATRQDIPTSLLAVCRKALALAPAARYPQVAALQADLNAWQNGFATRAENAGAWTQIKLLIRRHKAAAIGTAAVVTVGAVLGTGVLVQGRRATAALVSLRTAAPVFAEQAQSHLAEQKLDDAIAKLNFALTIDPANPDYLLRRANYLQAAARFDEAIPAYRQRLAIGEDASARASLALCEKLAALPADAALRELYDALKKQGRNLEAAPVATRLGLGSVATESLIREVLRPLEKMPEWDKNFNRYYRDGSGEFSLEINGLPLTDVGFLRKLRGLPIKLVSIGGTLVHDLSPLADLPLSKVNLYSIPATDFSPLARLKLTELGLSYTQLDSLEPFRNMPLRVLQLQKTHVTDFSPLRGLPLEELYLDNTRMTSLEMLSGAPLKILWIPLTHIKSLAGIEKCPLEKLVATDCSSLENIDAVRGRPLLSIRLGGCTAIKDLRPLLDCTDLESAILPMNGAHLEALRTHTNLKFLGCDESDLDEKGEKVKTSAGEFWARYDQFAAVSTALSKAGISLKEGQLTTKPGSGVVFYVRDAPLTDFTLLQPLPIDRLKLQGSKVTDLSSLKGSKIKTLSLEKSLVTDLSPLLEIPALETVVLPAKPANLEVLRKHPSLRFLGYEADWDTKKQQVKLTTAEFWQRHDAAKPGGE